MMIMEVFGDYYCLGPGVMYEICLAGQVVSLSMGMMMMSLEVLLPFCMLTEI